MTELIGKTFKRNKYGLSSWENTVSEVLIHYEIIDQFTKRPRIMIKGSGPVLYDIDEIVITNDPMNFVEKLILQKRETHERITKRVGKYLI